MAGVLVLLQRLEGKPLSPRDIESAGLRRDAGLLRLEGKTGGPSREKGSPAMSSTLQNTGSWKFQEEFQEVLFRFPFRLGPPLTYFAVVPSLRLGPVLSPC